jgi:peptide/nickel transport system substrate-binding protein
MQAFERYYAGRPLIDRVVFRPYSSTRAAWADMMRGQVDMLYDVGVDTVDLMRSSSAVKVFAFERPYISAVVFNMSRPRFKSKTLRRILNSAIDRDRLVSDLLKGAARPAQGPVSSSHWAYDASFPKFGYTPTAPDEDGPIRFACIVSEPSHEKVALFLQSQLRAIGVEVELEQLSLDAANERVAKGDFDAFLVDAISGPTMVRPYLFWHSKGPFNFGGFKSAAVDAALDSIRHAADDEAYKAGVAAFQRAIVDDPPAIFLAWSERARAVSTRFEVPVEPGRDILSTLRLWRPVPADN